MPSPFPGMDPFLESEALWPAFQHHLVACLYQALLPGLADRYRARIGYRRYVTEQALFTSVVRQEHAEEYIEVRRRGEERLLTLVDVVSPTNRTTPEGRRAYLTKRQETRLAGAHLVEVDLVRQGSSLFEPPGECPADAEYAIIVTRAMRPDRREVFSAGLRVRLPQFRMPLARDDRDTLIDLQAAFSRCYDRGGFAPRIDYQHDPATALSDDDRQWLNSHLRGAKIR